MSVRYTEDAAADLADAITYLAAKNPLAAADLYDRVTGLVAALDAKAFDGPEERLTTGETARSWPLYPYRVYYQRKGGVLTVLRVYHQARRPIARRRPRKRS